MQKLFSILIVLTTWLSSVFAGVSPTNPGPGTVWTVGKPYSITWDNSTSVTGDWSSFKIDLMTGANLNMVFLTNVVSGLNDSLREYTWIAPPVDPYSAIYFFQFTPASGEPTWTTRFAIVAKDGDIPAKEPNATQPGGEAIPWGIGKLAATTAPTTNLTIPSVSSVASGTATPVPATSALTTQSVTNGVTAEVSPTQVPSTPSDAHNQGAAIALLPSKLAVLATTGLVFVGWIIVV